ncbi:MAG: hypothetical protein DI529_17010 [Chryseobacterium sp.]|nr:MAG: hypothetical protein DI529_17010 [Chryseobacterium sp.]
MTKFSFLRTAVLGAALTISTTVFAQSTYKLVTSATDLVSGAKYVVASGSTGSVRLLGYENTNNRPQATTAVTVSSSTVSVSPATASTDQASAYEITLSGTTGAWVLTDAVNSIILGPSAGTGSNNYLKANADATFAITLDGSTFAAAIKAVTGTNTQGTTGGRNNLRYNTNSGNGLFACYAGDESSTITNTYLFKKIEPTMAVGNVNSAKVNLIKNTIVTNDITFGASAKVSVYNTAGQLVKTAEVSENSRLDVSALSKGTYIVTGIVNGETVSQKVIKK